MTTTEYREKYKSGVKAPRKKEETELIGAVVELLEFYGFLAVRVNSGAMKTAAGTFFRAYIIPGLTDANGRKGSSSGFPDVLGLRGKGDRIEAILIETKSRTGAKEESQKRFAAYARRRGVPVYYWKSIEEAEEFMRTRYQRKLTK